MAKKILAFVAAIMAFAVVPAVASATNSPELVESGTKVEVGKAIQATNLGSFVATTALGDTIWACETAALTWVLLKNDGANVEANITRASITNNGAPCMTVLGSTTVTAEPTTNGVPWCIRSTSTMVTDEFQIRGNSCTSIARPIRLVLDQPLGATCTYQRTAAIPGTFTTGSGKSVLSITKTEFVLLEGVFSCPAATYFDLNLVLETDGTNTRLDLI
jgi:hypothetical protein